MSILSRAEVDAENSHNIDLPTHLASITTAEFIGQSEIVDQNIHLREKAESTVNSEVNNELGKLGMNRMHPSSQLIQSNKARTADPNQPTALILKETDPRWNLAHVLMKWTRACSRQIFQCRYHSLHLPLQLSN